MFQSDQPKPYQEIPPEFDGSQTEGYMSGSLDDIDNISRWTEPKSLKDKTSREFSGFKIYNAIDGNLIQNREVSFVIATSGTYPQHIHRNSDAFFIVVDGKAIFLSGSDKFDAVVGAKIKIPKGIPHGFEINEGETLAFVSIQNPPIKNQQTDEEDFHLHELV